MSILQKKLDEIASKKKRLLIVEKFSGAFKEVLSNAPISNYPEANYFSAYPRLKGGLAEPSRADVDNWVNCNFQDLAQVVEKINTLQLSKNTMGWLSFCSTIPHFYIDGLYVKLHFNEILKYVVDIDDVDILWTGTSRDCGFIVEQYNQKGNYDFSCWGL